LSRQPVLYWLHLPLSILPVGIHRFLTDLKFARDSLFYIFVRPVKLYLNASFREQWLRDMIEQGSKNHLVTLEDADVILGQLKEPFIQKYLKSLAVHVCTLPVTQIVSVTIAWIYVKMHPEMSPKEHAAAVAAILVLFQITPVSPGSLARGLYVLYLVIRERNFKDYNIAVFLGFFKYVGYLAFPIQMAYRYPVLARFMAAHWATGAVHIVPVFGEKGALLEHGVFSLFYNVPLTLRRRMALRAEIRKKQSVSSWSVVPIVLASLSAFLLPDYLSVRNSQTSLPILKDIWYLLAGIPLLTGAAVTLTAGGLKISRRILRSVLCGLTTGFLYSVLHIVIGNAWQMQTSPLYKVLLWSVFLNALLAGIGCILTEIRLPEPKLCK